MPFIIAKFQKCGKNNCRCNSGHPHGPYYWLCTYKYCEGRQKRKIKWEYLGKNYSSVKNTLLNLGFNDLISEKELLKKIGSEAIENLTNSEKKSFSKKIFTYESTE